jgi:hypothetical protein
MARTNISNIALGVLVSATAISPTVTILDLKPNISQITLTQYPQVISVNDILPFRLRITNIGIEGYRQNNPPGIGVQVIGFSNYIL